jgi:hypothetical protein
MHITVIKTVANKRLDLITAQLVYATLHYLADMLFPPELFL